MDDYFNKVKEEFITRSVKFLKTSAKNGVGRSFIDEEKDRLRKIISCNNFDELITVEKNMLTANIKSNLTPNQSNALNNRSKNRQTVSRLRVKLLKKNNE